MSKPSDTQRAGRPAINVESNGPSNKAGTPRANIGEMPPAKMEPKVVASKRKGAADTAARTAKSQPRRKPKGKSASGQQREGRSNSKQVKVVAMLRAPAGTTIAAIMKATGWQQHSVRGFFAGVVRKKLRLNLGSKKVDGKRVYRIAGGGVRSGTRRPSHRAA